MQTFHIAINTAWLARLLLVSTTVAKILGARVGFFPTWNCLGHRTYSEGQTFGEEFSNESSLFQGSESKENFTFSRNSKASRFQGSKNYMFSQEFPEFKV